MDTLSASVLRDRKPQIGIVLGSGLGALAERIEGAEALPYSDIPGFPVSTAPGHKGRFVFAPLATKKWCSWTLHAGDLMLLTDHISSLVPSPAG